MRVEKNGIDFIDFFFTPILLSQAFGLTHCSRGAAEPQVMALPRFRRATETEFGGDEHHRFDVDRSATEIARYCRPLASTSTMRAVGLARSTSSGCGVSTNDVFPAASRAITRMYNRAGTP